MSDRRQEILGGKRRPDGAEPVRNDLERLAERLATRTGLRVARGLQKAGLLDSPADPRAAGQVSGPAAAPERPRPISIWRPRRSRAGLCFERPPPVPGGDHYAARRRLSARKSTRFRVCLLGESAAAGYLYAPHLTPAGVLEAQLGSAAGGGVFEVVDLARTNERLATLVDTARAALQLAPDILVVYAGNNWNLLETRRWSPQFPSVRGRLEYAARLADEGVEGPLGGALRERLAAADGALAELARSARSADADLVLVIPEVNLADWQTRQPVGWLPGRGVAAWYRLYERARRLLRRGEPEAASVVARRLLDLDGGACPTTYRVLAQAWRAMGRRVEAAEACRAEIAAAHYALACFLGAPQATPADQGLLERAARRHGLPCVDLRKAFAAHCGSPLPGRRLFLDYCHLTAEGMRVAMAAVAVEVLRRTRTGECGAAELAALPEPAVAVEADATAMLGAAVHGAHRLLAVADKQEILRHWCRRALAASADIADAMLDLVEARSAPLPAVLTAAQQRNLASPYRLTEQQGWRYDYPDAELIRAIAAVLEETGRPPEAVRERLLAVGRPGPVDLAAPPASLWEPLEQPYSDLLAPPDLPGRYAHRALWPVTTFCWLGGAEDTPLELLARLPASSLAAGQEAAPIEITVNGRAAGCFLLGRRWRRTRLLLPAEASRPGLQRIALHWPMPAAAGEAALAAARDRLACGLEADLHPVFGEVASLVVG